MKKLIRQEGDNRHLKTRLESQLSGINCQTFSTGLSSGHFPGGNFIELLRICRRGFWMGLVP